MKDHIFAVVRLDQLSSTLKSRHGCMAAKNGIAAQIALLHVMHVLNGVHSRIVRRQEHNTIAHISQQCPNAVQVVVGRSIHHHHAPWHR